MFEAIRLVMVQRLLSSAEFKMDPLVSLYYYAPACAIMNGLVSLVFEVPNMSLADISRVGFVVLLANASVAFLLNVSVVFLVSKYLMFSVYVRAYTYALADRQDLFSRPHPFRCPQRHPARWSLHSHFRRSSLLDPGFRLQHCPGRLGILQARLRQAEGVCRARRSIVGRIWHPPPCHAKDHHLWFRRSAPLVPGGRSAAPLCAGLRPERVHQEQDRRVARREGIVDWSPRAATNGFPKL